ncbi:hypothetical protein PoB_003292500 [Plakobranchus ocellatus]|uniref:Uncharacterized protein n=1 Tax=Plakobranchus ocellatus TaxID=259542 RepID=A0AAV4AI18_9GAST|nr:hypothetical protein PoB_003292500 [Plakobranchus ocellatus]
MKTSLAPHVFFPAFSWLSFTPLDPNTDLAKQFVIVFPLQFFPDFIDQSTILNTPPANSLFTRKHFKSHQQRQILAENKRFNCLPVAPTFQIGWVSLNEWKC